MEDAEEWAWKANKKDKKNKKGNAQKGHEKIIEDMNKKYAERRQKERELIQEREAKKKAEYEMKKAKKIEEAKAAEKRLSNKAAKKLR